MKESSFVPENESLCTRCNVIFKHYHPPCYFCGKQSWFSQESNPVRIFYCETCRDDVHEVMKENDIEFSLAANVLINSRINRFNHRCADMPKEPT